MIDSFEVIVAQHRYQEMVQQAIERQQLEQILGTVDRQPSDSRFALVRRLIARYWPSTVRIRQQAGEVPPPSRSEA